MEEGNRFWARRIPPRKALGNYALASFRDHTMQSEASREEIGRFYREAVEVGVGAVAIDQVWVLTASRNTRGTGIKVGSAAGFPLGPTHVTAKPVEEPGMVMNIGAMRPGNLEAVHSGIRDVVDIGHDFGCIIRVIPENAQLSNEHAGLDYTKSAPGLGRRELKGRCPVDESNGRAVDMRQDKRRQLAA